MKIIFISHCQENSFSHEKFCSWPRFESEGFWNSKMAYYISVGIAGAFLYEQSLSGTLSQYWHCLTKNRARYQ